MGQRFRKVTKETACFCSIMSGTLAGRCKGRGAQQLETESIWRHHQSHVWQWLRSVYWDGKTYRCSLYVAWASLNFLYGDSVLQNQLFQKNKDRSQVTFCDLDLKSYRFFCLFLASLYSFSKSPVHSYSREGAQIHFLREESSSVVTIFEKYSLLHYSKFQERNQNSMGMRGLSKVPQLILISSRSQDFKI